MPPRMIQQSCRPRVSDRTMVGSSATRLACEFQRTERRRHEEHENPTGGKKHGGPVAPRLTGLLRDRAKRSSSERRGVSSVAGAGCRKIFLTVRQGEVFFT